MDIHSRKPNSFDHHEHCAPILHRTSDHSSTTFGSNIVICIRHNVPTETPIAIIHNHPLLMLYTTLLAPLTFSLVTTLLPTRSSTTASCSIAIAVSPFCTRVLLSLFLHQVPRVCVNTVRFFGRLALRQRQLHDHYVNVMRVPFPWTTHHLTPYALVV